MEFVDALAAIRTGRRIEQAFYKSDFAISPAQVDVLDVLNENNRAGLKTRMSDLTKGRFCTPAVITGTVDRLEKLSLVRRVAGTGDRRLVYLEITPKGVTMLVNARALVENIAA